MKTRLLKVLAVLGILIAYVVICRILGFGIPCVFHLITGLNCPGCGTSRMLLALLKLDFGRAFSYNRVMFVLLPVLLFLILRRLYLYITGKKGSEKLLKVERILGIGCVSVLVVWGFLRNIWHI